MTARFTCREDSVVAPDDQGSELRCAAPGYAPLPVTVAVPGARTILATGGDLKTTFCLMGAATPISSHLGDMADLAPRRASNPPWITWRS